MNSVNLTMLTKLLHKYICLDHNNLYVHSIMQLLLVEVPDWVNTKDSKLENYSNNSSIGCFVEVNLDYSDELHDLCNDYYYLPDEKIKTPNKMLSEYQLQIIEYINYSLGENKKLILNLANKRKYKLHQTFFKFRVATEKKS